MFFQSVGMHKNNKNKKGHSLYFFLLSSPGPEDIINGNLKLILGLIWHLILRYQIGKSKFPTKKLMLAWLQAVIPDCRINNFTSDWNDGIALQCVLVLDFCNNLISII